MNQSPPPPPKKNNRPGALWPELEGRGKYPTPQELRVARTPPTFRSPARPREDSMDDVSSVFVPPEDLYWIKDSLHNLRNEKADRAMLVAAVKTFEEKIDMLVTRIEEATHCQKTAEFTDLKEAVTTWRTFFRNTVAVGSLGALLVMGGWLWQYYALVDQVRQTSENVARVTSNVDSLHSDYQKYKQDRFAENIQNKSETTEKFVHLEYKLLSAMSKLSQGQKIAEPRAPQSAVTQGDTAP